MIRRYLHDRVLDSLKHFRVVLITGARQVGKSTLAQQLIGSGWDARYVTLDDRTALDAALRDSDGFISGTPTPVVIDEVQKAPDLLRAIKRVVDRDPAPGQYLLTGSANIMTLAAVSESLAGRVGLNTLYPFSWPEFSGKPRPRILEALFEAETARQLMKLLPKAPEPDRGEDIKEWVLRGGYPIPAQMESAAARNQWFSSYRQTYLERDLLNIRAIENLPDFNRLLGLAAFRTGGLLNSSDLSRESGLPFTTLRRYINLLDVTYQTFLLQPYFSNIGKRLVKTPKFYMSDTGMASHLMGADEWTMLARQGREGAMIETWIAQELQKLIAVSDSTFHLFFWRTHSGQEVDFLVEKGGKLVAVEVKWGHRIKDADVQNLKRCAEDLKERLLFSVILYGGTDPVAFTPKIVGIPFPMFFGI